MLSHPDLGISNIVPLVGLKACYLRVPMYLNGTLAFTPLSPLKVQLDIPEILLNFPICFKIAVLLVSFKTNMMSTASIYQHSWILFLSQFPPHNHLGLIIYTDNKIMLPIQIVRSTATLYLYLYNCFIKDREAIIYSFLFCPKINNVVQKAIFPIMN